MKRQKPFIDSNPAYPLEEPPATNHTPTPWECLDHYSEGKHDGHIIVGPDGFGIARLWHTKDFCLADDFKKAIVREDANAEFIVRAVNSHADLLEAIETMLSSCGMYESQSWSSREEHECWLASQKARAAIAKATDASTSRALSTDMLP